MIEKINIKKIFQNSMNPRIIKDFKFKKLVNSIKEFPEMLELRPIIVNQEGGIIGGNMRYRACKELGLKEVFIIRAENLTEKQIEQFIIKDNVGFGEWDWDMIANGWDTQEITDWGLEIKTFGENIADDEWVGMPDFEQEDNMPKNRIMVSFENDDDRIEFGKLIGQNITKDTKSIWHPKLTMDKVKDLRY